MALPDLNQFVAAPDPSGRAADPAVALTQTDSLGLPDLNQFVAAPDPEGRVADAELRQFVPEHDGKGLADEFVSGLSGGVDNLQMTLFGVAGLAGRELGIKTLEDFGIRGAERNVVEAQNSGRESGGFTDIETAGGFFKWAAASLGEALPSLGLAIAGGGVGGVLAKKAVEGGVRRAIRDRVVKDLLGKGFSRREAAESAVRFIGSKQGNTLLSRAASTGATRAGTVGRAFGAAGASIPPQVGAIDLELQERGIDAGLTALLGGVVGGALEALPAIRLMDKMFPGVQTQVAKSFVKDFAVSVGAQTMIEGSTEAAQEMIQLAAMAYHDPSFDLFDPANANRVIDAFAAGAIVGTVTGGGAEAIGAVTSPRKLAPPVEVEEFALDDDTDKTPEGFTPADNTLFEEVRGRILGVVAPMIEPAVNSLSGAAKKAFSALDSDMGGGMHREATKLSQVIKDGHNRFLETHAAELTQLKEYIKNKSAEVYRIAETFSDPELRSQFIKDEMEVVRANVEGLSNKLKERAAKRDEQTSAEVDNMDFSDVDVADIFEQEAPVVDERQVPDVGDVDAVPVMTFGRNQLSPKVGVSGKETVVAYKTQADARKGRTKLKLKFPGAKNDAFRIAKHESGKGWVIEGIDPTLRDDVKFWNDFDSARDSGGRRRNNPRKVTLKGVDGTQFGYKFKNLIIDVATMAFKGKNLDPNATTMQQGFRAFAGEMLSRGIINNDQFTELETAANKVLDADAIIEEAPLDKEQTRAQRQTELANASRIEREFSGNATLGQTGLPSSATPSSGDLGDTRGNIAGAPDASVSVSNEGGVEVKDFAVDPQKDDRVTDPKTKPSEFESRFSRFDKATGKVDRSNRDNAKELSKHDQKILARYGKPGAFKMLTSINMPFAVQSALSSIGNFVTKRLGLSNQVTMVDDHGLQLLIDRGIVSDPIFQQTLTDPAVHARNIRIGDQSFVYLSQKVLSDPVTTIAAFGHEMGHHLYRVAWDKLTPEAQQRLRSAYEAQAKSPSDAGFNEWMADQLAAWIVRPIRQGGDPGQFFFQKVAQNVRKLYDFITKNPRFQLDETFQQFADAVALKVTTDVDPEANPYNQALLKAWFRDEGVTMYEWFGDVLEAKNVDNMSNLERLGKMSLNELEIVSSISNVFPEDGSLLPNFRIVRALEQVRSFLETGVRKRDPGGETRFATWLIDGRLPKIPGSKQEKISALGHLIESHKDRGVRDPGVPTQTMLDNLAGDQKVVISLLGETPQVKRAARDLVKFAAKLIRPGVKIRVINEATAVAMADDTSHPHSDIAEALLDTGNFSVYESRSDRSVPIYIMARGRGHGELDSGFGALALTHELGHVIHHDSMERQGPGLQKQLRKAFREDLAKRSTGRELNFSTTERDTTADTPATDTDAEFDEWMADQFVEWMGNRRTPTNAMERFLEGVAVKIQAMWDFMNLNPGRYGGLNMTYEKWIDQVAESVGEGVADVGTFDKLKFKLDRALNSRPLSKRGNVSGIYDFKPVTAEGKKALARVEKKYPAVVARAIVLRNWMVAAYKMAIAPSTSAVRDMIPRIPTAARLVTMFNREAHGEAKIAQNYHQALELMRGQFMGKFTKMRNGIATQIKAKNPGIKNKELQKLINARMREIGQSLQSKDSDPNATFTKEEQVIRDLFDNMHAYALKAGLPVHKVVNYFPRQFSRKLLVDNKQKILDHLTAGKMPLEAARSLYNSLIDPTANDGRATQDATETPGFKAMNSRTVQDKFFDQFLDDDTQGIVGNYINQVTKRAEFNRRLGERMPVSELTAKEAIAKGIWDPKGKMHKILAQAKKEGATDEDLVVLENYIDANLGQLGRDSALAKPGARRFMAAVMAYQNMRVLMFTVFASLPDGAGPAIRSGSMRDTWKVLKNQIGDMASQEGDLAQMARTLGIIQDAASDHIMTEYVDNHYMPAKLRKMNDSFFKYTGLNWYTDFTRKYALAVGIDYIEQSYNNSLNGATAQEKARGKDMLAELGMTPAQAKEWIAAGKPTYDSQAHDMKGSERAAAEALIQFVDESIMRPNASQRPILASHPGAMLVYHLKGYMYAVHDIILKRVKFNIDEAESPAQYVAAISPAIAMMLLTAVGLELRELIQYAGSDRKPPTDRMDGWEYTWELSQRSGLTGFAQIGFDFEGAGDRGMSQVAGIGGPALSQAANIISRPSTQTIPKAIPIIGQIPAAREIVRDVIK